LQVVVLSDERQKLKSNFDFGVTSQQIILLGTDVGGFILNIGEPIIDGNFLLFRFAVGKSNRAFEVGESLFIEESGESDRSHDVV